MAEIITMCGFRCDICPAYNPNIRGMEDREKISAGWKKYFGFDFKPEDIGCVGCRNEGKHADSGCPVRPCVIDKKFNSCAECPNFGCEKLKTRLDFIESLHLDMQSIPEDDYNRFIRPYLGRENLEKLRKR